MTARIALPALLAALVAGCGSAGVDELPPAAGPPSSPPLSKAPAGQVTPLDRAVARPPLSGAAGPDRLVQLHPRARQLDLLDAHTGRRLGSAPAGLGPTSVACIAAAGPCFVLDTRGEALLVYALRGHRVEPTRRLYLPGGPYGVALDTRRHRLWVTLPALNQLVELPDHWRPHVLRRFHTVRQPDGVAVDERSGRVFVTGTGLLETIDAG